MRIMSLAALRDMFLWCLIINYGILVLWFIVFISAREFIYRLHGRWFKLTPSQFDGIHYSGMAIYKIAIFIFNVTPLLGLIIVGDRLRL